MGNDPLIYWVTIIGGVAAIASLIISLVALDISKKVMIYSSKEYTPRITYNIDDDTDELVFTHHSHRLFKIDWINFLRIDRIGFESTKRKTIISIPFITESKMFRYIEKDGHAKKTIINKNTTGPCAYGICPYDEELVNKVDEKIQKNYGLDSKKGYALPSLQSRCYVVEVVYTNKAEERNSVILFQNHLHGHGYDKTTLNGKGLGRLLNDCNHPKLETLDELWKYLIEKFEEKFD